LALAEGGAFSRARRYLEKESKEHLRFLWKLGRFHLPKGVWKEKELEPRISLDEELTFYVLVELAIEIPRRSTCSRKSSNAAA